MLEEWKDQGGLASVAADDGYEILGLAAGCMCSQGGCLQSSYCEMRRGDAKQFGEFEREEKRRNSAATAGVTSNR